MAKKVLSREMFLASKSNFPKSLGHMPPGTYDTATGWECDGRGGGGMQSTARLGETVIFHFLTFFFWHSYR